MFKRLAVLCVLIAATASTPSTAHALSVDSIDCVLYPGQPSNFSTYTCDVNISGMTPGAYVTYDWTIASTRSYETFSTPGSPFTRSCYNGYRDSDPESFTVRVTARENTGATANGSTFALVCDGSWWEW